MYIPDPDRHHIADLIEKRRLCCQNVQLLAEALVVSFTVVHLYGLVLEGAHRQKTDALVVAFTFVHPYGLVPKGVHRQGRGLCGEVYFCTSMWLNARRCTMWLNARRCTHTKGRSPCGEFLQLYICMA